MKKDIEEYKKIYYTEDPMTGELASSLRSKIFKVYTEIRTNAYYVSNPRDDILIYVNNESNPYQLNHLPAAIIVAHLVNRSSTLLDGSPGGGKTKTIKIVSRLMTGSSLKKVDYIIYCDEELTKEKWMAIPDVERMLPRENKPESDKEEEFKVIWAPFFRDDYNGINLIADEINRANPRTQNEFLSLMAEGIVQYAVSAEKNIPEFRMFLTRNPIDAKIGSNVYPLHFAFLDRITQSIRALMPSAYSMERVYEVRKDDRNYEFDEESTIKPIMSVDDVRKATILATKIPVTEDGIRYARYLARDPSLCLNAPGYDKTLVDDKTPGSSLCDGCHFNNATNYHCTKYYGGSMRPMFDLIAIAKAYCFWLAIPEVNEHIIKSVALDVLSHRVIPISTVMSQDKDSNDTREYLNKYLVNWCFTKLDTRKDVEEAYNRLYHGTSTTPDKDQHLLILNAKQDLYVLADLLPVVMRVEMDGNKIKENGQILASTDNTDYREKAREIKAIQANKSIDVVTKIKKLNDIRSDLEKGTIPFTTNLLDMIFANKRELDDLRNKQMFKNVKAS